jgi:hypothetical protein
MEERGVGGWWPFVKPYFEEAPGRVAVARDSRDKLCGFQVSMTPGNAPQLAWHDPLVGPWLNHTRSLPEGERAVLWHDSIDFSGDPQARVEAMLGMAGVLRSGLDNPRYAFLPIDPNIPAARAFAEANGAKHVEELDLAAEGQLILECWIMDHGEGGLLGAQRALVYKELGLSRPPERGAATRAGEADLAQAVRDALRDVRVPHKLAASPLATGSSPEARAASARAVLEDATEHAFGDTENERLLQRVLMRGYLDPAPSHEQAAEELMVSRSTYFRRLRIATDRVADYVVAAR